MKYSSIRVKLAAIIDCTFQSLLKFFSSHKLKNYRRKLLHKIKASNSRVTFLIFANLGGRVERKLNII